MVTAPLTQAKEKTVKQVYPISNTMYLVQETLQSAPVPQITAVNHIVIIDCSGSMSGELSQIRQQLKNKLPKLLNEQDTVSIIWFSGKGQFGTLIEAEPVATLADLQCVNKAIDRWLKPIGLTGFKEPLQEAQALTKRVAQKTGNPIFNLFFMSDGCDNQWRRSDILSAIESLSVASATFVEYGYYADRNLLSAMAEKAGGTLIFSDGFDTYAPSFEAAISKKVSGAPRKELAIAGDVVGGFVFALDDGDIVASTVQDGKASIPGHLEDVYYLSPTKPTGSMMTVIEAPLYAALSLFATRMRPDVIYPILRALGDVKFIDDFAGCFGKQKYTEFMESSKLAAFGTGRYTKGCDPTRVPNEDAFTVLDLLDLLTDDDRVLLDHPAFKYNRIGRKRIDANETLTEAEITDIQECANGLGDDPSKLAELQAKLTAAISKKALKFVPDANPDGYSIASLTYHEERPNISFLVKRTGTVELPWFQNTSLYPTLPQPFPTFVYRNYALVKDGMVNIEVLPAKLCTSTLDALLDVINSGRLSITAVDHDGRIDDGIILLNLRELPLVNRTMVKSASAKTLFEKEYSLTLARAAQKVYGTFKKERFTRSSKSFSVLYGDNAAAWLKEQGITDYSGFSPKSVQAESTDFYLGKELKVSLKGLSSLPSVKDVKAQMDKGKLNAGAKLMQPYVQEVEDFLASTIYKSASNQDNLFETWLDGKTKQATADVRKLLFELARIKFAIIVGQVWFNEFASLDENTLTVTVDGQSVDGKVEMREVEIKI